MLVREATISENEKFAVKRITYTRDGSKFKVGKDTDAILREVAYIYRHSLFPIKEMVIREGQDIEYTQEVKVQKAVKKDAIGNTDIQHKEGKNGAGESTGDKGRPQEGG